MKKIRRAAFALSSLLLLSPAAKASDWGCQVLLCLSNPAGPMAVAACVPPITKLWAALRKPKPDPFPTCDEAKSSSHGDSFARQGYGYFNQCPAGTAALGAGVTAMQVAPSVYADLSRSNSVYFGTDLQPATRDAIGSAPVGRGIGEGDGLAPSVDEPTLPNKVCAAGELGPFMLPGDDGNAYQVNAFQQVVILPAQSSAAYIDVFVNEKLYKRVRY